MSNPNTHGERMPPTRARMPDDSMADVWTGAGELVKRATKKRLTGGWARDLLSRMLARMYDIVSDPTRWTRRIPLRARGSLYVSLVGRVGLLRSLSR